MDSLSNKSEFGVRFFTVVAMILVAAAFRLIPHPPNFSPIAAMALFGGAMIAPSRWSKSLAIGLPLLAMLLSDLVLGFHSTMPAVYLSFVLISVIGIWLRSNRSPLRVGVATLLGSILFFVVTNFAVWAAGGFYEKSLAGLIACYVAAVPFFQNSLAGDAFFTAFLFGTWAFAERNITALRPAYAGQR